MAQRRNLTSGSGGVGTATAQIAINGKYFSGDTFSVLSDLLNLSNAVLERRTVDLTASTELEVPLPTGTRLVFVELPYGNTTGLDISDTTAKAYWALNPDGWMLSTISADTTSIFLTPGAANITGVKLAFV